MNILLATLGIAALLPHTPVQNQGKSQAPKRQIVIAHRGASGYLPEHTLQGVAMAYQMGVDFIEPDCVLSKDNIPVVVHDTHIDSISDVAKKFPDRKRKDGRFYAIDFTLAELKTLAVSERFDPATGKAVYPKRFPLGVPGFTIRGQNSIAASNTPLIVLDGVIYSGSMADISPNDWLLLKGPRGGSAFPGWQAQRHKRRDEDTGAGRREGGVRGAVPPGTPLAPL